MNTLNYYYLLSDGFQYALDGFRVKHRHFEGGTENSKKKKGFKTRTKLRAG